jgi:hemerythrin-like domain-containing protein
MAHDDIAHQTLVEHGLLRHITEALRLTAARKARGHDLCRTLSTLRFIAQSFERHLERLMALEEHDGYMGVVLRTEPRLAKSVDALREEHGQFRGAVGRLTRRLQQVSAADPEAFAAACDELLGFLDRVDRHSDRESGLVQEALARDGGGEG